ncbi:MAG: RimK/LysX family protein [Flavobacteriales bacterium]|nr:RimK/LysX family protein [Flavobacteriales bacterium]
MSLNPEKYKVEAAKVKPVVGRSEKIDLPKLGLEKVDAKIDTGAYGCSMHCSLIDVVTDEDGIKMLKIIPLHWTDKAYDATPFFFPYTNKKKVKNSSGKIEERYLIKTTVRIFGRDIETVFSITDRSKMKFPILLGRKFLQKRFVVDVSVKDRSEKQKAKKKTVETK